MTIPSSPTETPMLPPAPCSMYTLPATFMTLISTLLKSCAIAIGANRNSIQCFQLISAPRAGTMRARLYAKSGRRWRVSSAQRRLLSAHIQEGGNHESKLASCISRGAPGRIRGRGGERRRAGDRSGDGHVEAQRRKVEVQSGARAQEPDDAIRAFGQEREV